MSLTPPSPSLFGGSSTFDMTHDDPTTVTSVTKQEVYKRVTGPATTTTTITATTIPTTAPSVVTSGGPVITEVIEESTVPSTTEAPPTISPAQGTESKLLVHLNLEDMTKNAAQAVQIEGKEADKASAIVTADKDTVTMQIDLKGLDGQRIIQRRSVHRSATKGTGKSTKAVAVKAKDGKPETEEERRIRMLTTRKNELNQRLNIWKGIFVQKHNRKPNEEDMAKHADLVRWFGELTEIRKELADLGFYQYPVKPSTQLGGQQSPRRAPKFEGYVPDDDDQIEMHNDKLKRQLGEWRAQFLSQFGRNPTEDDIQQHSNIYKVYLELTANRQHLTDPEHVEEVVEVEEDEEE